MTGQFFVFMFSPSRLHSGRHREEGLEGGWSYHRDVAGSVAEAINPSSVVASGSPRRSHSTASTMGTPARISGPNPLNRGLMDFSNSSNDELNALQRALLEARFSLTARDEDVWASPFVIDLHVTVVKELLDRARREPSDRALQSLERWLSWEGHAVEEQVLIRRLKEDSHWLSLSKEKRVAYLADLIAPFRADPERIANLAVAISPLRES